MATNSTRTTDTTFDRRQSASSDAPRAANARARRSADAARTARPASQPGTSEIDREPLSPKKRVTRDGRQPLVVYMRPEAIKALKIAALEDDTTASAIVSDAVASWLDSRAKGREPHEGQPRDAVRPSRRRSVTDR